VVRPDKLPEEVKQIIVIRAKTKTKMQKIQEQKLEETIKPIEPK